MFKSAGLTLVDDEFEKLANVIMNGRQIRNLTRLASILHPDSEIKLEDMWDVLEYGSWQLAERPAIGDESYATQA
jgi:hypothetical protein